MHTSHRCSVKAPKSVGFWAAVRTESEKMSSRPTTSVRRRIGFSLCHQAGDDRSELPSADNDRAVPYKGRGGPYLMKQRARARCRANISANKDQLGPCQAGELVASASSWVLFAPGNDLEKAACQYRENTVTGRSLLLQDMVAAGELQVSEEVRLARVA